MECNRCGNCCKRVLLDIDMKGASIENATDFISYLLNHNIKVKTTDFGTLELEVPVTCRYLEEVDGKFNCSIYKDRPAVCKNYACREK